MSSKRPLPDNSHGPPAKKSSSYLDPIGAVSTVEELDVKLLRFQNRKLAEKIELRRKNEIDLKSRIDQLEARLTTDDDVLMILNRYWNQLDEDIRVLLQRFDAETAESADGQNESAVVTSFLAQLSTWDKEELDQKLQQRVVFSKRAIGKLLQAFDRLLQRYDKLVLLVEKSVSKSEKAEIDIKEEVKEENDSQESTSEGNPQLSLAEKNAELAAQLIVLEAENKRLHQQATSLHQRHHTTTLKFSELSERIERYETEVAELKNKCEDLQYESDCAKERAHKLERQLQETAEKMCQRSQTSIAADSVEQQGSDRQQVVKHKYDEEMEEHRELAHNRLTELEILQSQYQEALRTIEQLRMDLKTLPENVIFETTEYTCLKSQYSVLFNEAQQIKNQLDECRLVLHNTKNLHLRHIEQMESDELICQKKLRAEIIQLESMLAQVRKEYEVSRIELEQTLAANEQTGPINREMRNLITSLTNHNLQLKAELQRYKRKFRDVQNDLSKLKASERENPKSEAPKAASNDSACAASGSDLRPAKDISTDELIGRKDEVEEMVEQERKKGKSDSDIVANMKQQLKKALDNQKEMKLLLDMYKSAPKEQKDKVQLMTAEKKAKQEIEDLKEHIKLLKESERKEKRKLADGEALKKIKKYEEQIAELKKEIAHQKQEEEELLKEMEVTGQAYEEKQEQNIRLVQQLKEKDDANFKLMSERIKSSQIHKLLKEEKELLQEQITTLQTQVEAQNQVVRKLEEKERILQSSIQNYEKEMSLRVQAMEAYKRKAMEAAQTAADLKLHLEKYHSQLQEAQTAVADKTTTLDQQSYKYRRITEELASLKRKYERSKKIELSGNSDEVLLEEIREYKEQLTCPSCKVKKKDAVLTKCFHVFCLECLKTRYETRQRKCPKCNAAFGANDYHRIYIS